MKTGLKFWIENGFIKSEASAFKYITIESITDSPYLQNMVRDRRRRMFRAIRDKLTPREYNFRIRKMYVDKGYAKNTTDLLLIGGEDRRKYARSKVFNLFNAYKNAYAPHDRTGKLIETPRKKAHVKKKRINPKDTIAQAIRKHQDTVDETQKLLRYPMDKSRRTMLNNKLKYNLDAINKLKSQG